MNSQNELLPRIRQRMREIRLTQTALARYLGIDQGNLSRRLSGQTPFTNSEMALLESLLGLSTLAGEGLGDPALPFFAQALGSLTERSRREFLLLAASVLEGKLREPARSQVCGALRLLAGGNSVT